MPVSDPSPRAVITRRAALGALLIVPLACGRRDRRTPSRDDLYPNETPALRRQIEHYARLHDVPVPLVQHVVLRESGHNPAARNGPYYGLMQIHPQTAATMGYRGPPSGLLQAETNLNYGVKYLRGAWLVSGGDEDAAIGWYARGYYYEAKRLGLLQQTGLRG